MKIAIIILALLMGCADQLPFSELSATQKDGILQYGYINGYSGYFNEAERLTLMEPPVIVISKGEVSHGVFRDKYKTYDVVVRAGNGKFYTLSNTAWESVKVGDILK